MRTITTRSTRARLLHLLFSHGWDIYNGNRDQRITLSNIERKIIESDAFVFTPGATLEDMFKAISIFVGYQALDCNLAGKPTVVLNSDFSWDPFFSRALAVSSKMGTIHRLPGLSPRCGSLRSGGGHPGCSPPSWSARMPDA
ncbi:MAG: hypothetical protein QM755_18305 [Luteolibacter sp.]